MPHLCGPTRLRPAQPAPSKVACGIGPTQDDTHQSGAPALQSIGLTAVRSAEAHPLLCARLPELELEVSLLRSEVARQRVVLCVVPQQRLPAGAASWHPMPQRRCPHPPAPFAAVGHARMPRVQTAKTLPRMRHGVKHAAEHLLGRALPGPRSWLQLQGDDLASAGLLPISSLYTLTDLLFQEASRQLTSTVGVCWKETRYPKRAILRAELGPFASAQNAT